MYSTYTKRQHNLAVQLLNKYKELYTLLLCAAEILSEENEETFLHAFHRIKELTAEVAEYEEIRTCCYSDLPYTKQSCDFCNVRTRCNDDGWPN